MNGSEIRNMFLNSIPNEDATSAYLITEIGESVKVNIDLDEEGMNYSYSVDILELSQSNISKDTLLEMVSNGWQVSKDRKKLVKNC